MADLLTQLLLAPLCVVGVSLAGRRWGVAVAGILGGLPVVAGPILVVLTLVHGRPFEAEAAAGTLLGTAVLPTWWIPPVAQLPVASASPACSAVKRLGQRAS